MEGCLVKITVEKYNTWLCLKIKVELCNVQLVSALYCWHQDWIKRF